MFGFNAKSKDPRRRLINRDPNNYVDNDGLIIDDQTGLSSSRTSFDSSNFKSRKSLTSKTSSRFPSQQTRGRFASMNSGRSGRSGKMLSSSVNGLSNSQRHSTGSAGSRNTSFRLFK